MGDPRTPAGGAGRDGAGAVGGDARRLPARGRAPDDLRRHPPPPLRRLGAERALGVGDRGVQQLGRATASDAVAVRGFLIGSALFWLKHFHADGLRVDAVASMLYRDYSRREGEWITNRYDGRENLEAIDFLQELSRVVVEEVPGAMLVAEESTAWPGVTRAADAGGLGFMHKWNMGWMHDTLRYIGHEPV